MLSRPIPAGSRKPDPSAFPIADLDPDVLELMRLLWKMPPEERAAEAKRLRDLIDSYQGLITEAEDTLATAEALRSRLEASYPKAGA